MKSFTAQSDLPSTSPKRRKLKHPRTARACAFCRRRKVRCSGTEPCDYCHGEGVRCEYDDGHPRPPLTKLDRKPSSITRHGETTHSPQALLVDGSLGQKPSIIRTVSQTLATNTALGSERLLDRPAVMSRDQTSNISRGASQEPTFAEGHHISAASGVSFLHEFNRSVGPTDREDALQPALLTCYGDIAPVEIRQDQRMPSREEADSLLERYFRFATPTYRFLHQPTLEVWTSRFLTESRLAAAEAACVLLVFSQALLYTKDGDRHVDAGDQDLIRRQFYFEKAKSLLSQEPGPASIASVQSRLTMCLYLLSTFRINECRFCFNLACTISSMIGLHRKSPATAKLDLVVHEMRKRTFWCAYILDGYLSVLLGRPRMIRDEDVDQPYPRNIDDQDLQSTESPQDLPLHGNLEAFIAHAELAKLMGRNSDLLYSLQTLTEDQLFDRTSEMLDAVSEWRDRLPDFLKPRDKTLAGHRTFERQNTVLKLAWAHLRILATRRCLLADFSRLGQRTTSILDDRAVKPIRECVAAISTILNAIVDMIQKGAHYQSFWFTQYVTLVAVSTLYVYVIQSSRANIPPTAHPEAAAMFDMAKLCQDHLAASAPEGTQARRHCHLLGRLRQRAEMNAVRANQAETAAAGLGKTAGPTTSHDTVAITRPGPSTPSQQPPFDFRSRSIPGVWKDSMFTTDVSFQGFDAPPMSLDASMTGQFTPSDDDFVFQSLAGLDWESLDIVGFPGDDMFSDLL